MRYQLLDNELVNIDESQLINTDNQYIQLEDSLLFEITEVLKDSESHKQTAVVVFNQDMQVLPMISDWLSTELSNLSSVGSIKTYAKNITYYLEYLSTISLNKNKTLDSAFLHINI